MKQRLLIRTRCGGEVVMVVSAADAIGPKCGKYGGEHGSGLRLKLRLKLFFKWRRDPCNDKGGSGCGYR